MDASGNVQGIKSALEGIEELKVADYQRDYSWGPNQIDDLWGDIERLLDEDVDQEHFLGTLILQKTDSPAAVELVDGQQRLTTIFMFASVLLDFAKMHPSRNLVLRNGRTYNVAQELENFLLGQSESTVGARLIPLVFLNKIFRSITDIGLTRTERLKAAPKSAKKGDSAGPITLPMRRAYNHIDAKLKQRFKDFDPASDRQLEEVHRVARVLLEQLKVLKLVTNDQSDSLDVFMTLNNRGTPLGVFDLFRGEVLKARLAETQPEQRNALFLDSIDEWNQLMENLNGFSADKYLRHFALIKNYEFDTGSGAIRVKGLTAKALPKWSSDHISQSPNPGHSAERLWNEAVKGSEDYGYMLRPTNGDFSDYYLESLKLIGDSYRVLLLALDLGDDDIWTKEKRAIVLRHTFELFLKWTLANKNAQELEGLFQRWAVEFIIGEEASRIANLTKAIKGAADFTLDLEANLSGELDMSVAKALMLIIEANLTPGSIKVDLDKIQLEHIAPQKQTESWLAAIGGEESQYDSWVQNLGNLVVLDSKLNSSIKQSDFAKKKQKYRESRLVTVDDLVHFQTWSTTEIERRRDWAIEAIQAIFGGQKIVKFCDWDG